MLGTIFSPRGLRVAIPSLVAGLVGAGALFALVEDLSVWDGVWWAVTTVTTVGDGALTPATVPGRLVGIAVMVLGIGFLLVLAGAMVEHFVREEETVLSAPERQALAKLEAIEARLARLEERLGAAQEPGGPPSRAEEARR